MSKDKCKHGHDLTGDNIYVNPSGFSECRICRRAAARRYRATFDKYPERAEIDKLYKSEHWFGHTFGGNRELAIKRDGGKCVSCGMTREEHKLKYKKDITVDHIDGKGANTPSHLKNNSLDNLQTMCLSCHGRKDRVRNGTRQQRLTEEDVRDILMFASKGMSRWQIAKGYQMMHKVTIADVVLRHSWKWVEL